MNLTKLHKNPFSTFATVFVIIGLLTCCDKGGKRSSPHTIVTPKPSGTWDSTIPEKDKIYPYCQNFVGEYQPQTPPNLNLIIKSLVISLSDDRTQINVIFDDDSFAQPIIGNDPISLSNGSTAAAGCRDNMIYLSYTPINTLNTLYFRLSLIEEKNQNQITNNNHKSIQIQNEIKKLLIETLDDLGNLLQQTTFITK